MASAGEEYVYTGSANGAPFVFFYDSLMRNVGSVRTDNLNGEYVFQVPDGASYMRAQSFAWTDSTSDVTLSLREKDVAALLLQGHSQAAIAGQLFVAASTVNTHVKHIYRKACVNSKQEFIDLCQKKLEEAQGIGEEE